MLGTGALGCGNDVQPAPAIDVTVDDQPSSARYGQVAVAPIYPDLMTVGGALTLQVAPVPPSTTRPFTVPASILLIHRGPDEWVALDAACPHLGCPLGYSPHDQLVKCPCHGSRFRSAPDPADKKSCAGQVMHRPARSDLTAWDVVVESDGAVYVNLRSDSPCPALPPVVDGKIVLPLGDYPALAEAGGSIAGTPRGLGDRIIVVRVDDQKVVALTDICTHMGCHVEYEADHRGFHCPCHDSTFDLQGDVTGGPAPAPLRTYSAQLAGDSIIVLVS
jgi:Rieske Fe-S protein